MYNFNDLINLAMNSMEFEGLKHEGLLMFLLDMGINIGTADDVISAIDYELALVA